MTQQPFSRPGAFDLSGLKQPAPAAGSTGGGSITSAYALEVTEQNFQSLLEKSMQAPVLLAFHSPSRMPESTQLARDVATVVGEYDGRFLAGLIDIDRVPAIAQAMQIPSVPLVVAVIDGRPAPMLQDIVAIDQLRAMLNQLAQGMTAQGITGRHQPLQAAPTEDGEEPASDPRYAAAEAALDADDLDGAIAEYQRLVSANPADKEAAAGLTRARLLKRTADADLNAARAVAAEQPDDVDAQTLVADLDLLGGHVDDAFNRLISLIARSADPERTRAREHLLELFNAVGNDDARVQAGRRNLASALF